MPLKKDQIALSNFPYHKYSLSYALDSLQRLGAKAMELYLVEPHFHLEDCGMPELLALKKALRDRGLHPVCMTPEQVRYPINIASSNPVGRKRSLDTFSRCIYYASKLECPVVLFHAGYPLNDESYEDAWKRSVESLGYLARLAEGCGVTIALESVDVRWKTVLTSTKKTAEVLRLISSPNLKGMVDTITLAVCEETIDEALENLGGDIAHVHFSDGTGRKDQIAHLAIGEGRLDLASMLGALSRIEYKGYLGVELISPYEDNPEDAMGKTARWLHAHTI